MIDDKKPTPLSLRRYRCHKIVGAAEITRVDLGGGAKHPPHVRIMDTAGVEVIVRVSRNFFARFTPKPGDYLVQYEDGYLSASPKAAFEAGYLSLTEFDLAASAEQS